MSTSALLRPLGARSPVATRSPVLLPLPGTPVVLRDSPEVMPPLGRLLWAPPPSGHAHLHVPVPGRFRDSPAAFPTPVDLESGARRQGCVLVVLCFPGMQALSRGSVVLSE